MESKSTLLYKAVHYYIPSFLASLLFIGAICDVYGFEANVYDYGLFTNITWNFSQGDGWLASFYADTHRENFLGDHWALIIPLLAPFFYIFPSPYTYAILQALALGSLFFIIPLLVRKIGQENQCQDYLFPSLFLSLTLFFFKGFMAAAAYQTHLVTLVLPFVLLAIYSLHTKKLWLTWLCCLLVALSQERGIVSVVAIGIYAFLITKNRYFGFLLCLLATFYFILAVKVFIPSFSSNDAYIYNTMIAPLALWDLKITYLLLFFSSFFFMPFLGKKACFAFTACIPLFAVGLISNRDDMLRFSHQYQDMLSIFVLVASIHGVFWLLQKPFFEKTPRKRVFVATCFALIILAESSFWFSPVRIAALSLTNPVVHQVHEDMRPYSNIPEKLTVYTTTGIGSHLAMRTYIQTLTMDNATIPFTQSVVVMTPNLNIHPNPDPIALEQALRSNKSLTLIEDTGELLVFASTDVTTIQAPQ